MNHIQWLRCFCQLWQAAQDQDGKELHSLSNVLAHYQFRNNLPRVCADDLLAYLREEYSKINVVINDTDARTLFSFICFAPDVYNLELMQSDIETILSQPITLIGELTVKTVI